MKKLIAILFASLLILTTASAEYDFSAMTDDAIYAVIDAARAELQARHAQESEKIYLINDEYVELYLTGHAAKDTSWEYSLEVIMENKSDMDLMVSMNYIITNGWKQGGYGSMPSAPAGIKARGWLDIEYEACGLSSYTEIDTVKLCNLYIFDTNSCERIATYGDIILDIGGRVWN
jgi:hypothetical protein